MAGELLAGSQVVRALARRALDPLDLLTALPHQLADETADAARQSVGGRHQLLHRGAVLRADQFQDRGVLAALPRLFGGGGTRGQPELLAFPKFGTAQAEPVPSISPNLLWLTTGAGRGARAERPPGPTRR